MLSVGNYQRKMQDENPERDHMSIIIEAHEQIIKDFAEAVAEGKQVVMAHTLYKAKRRIDYIEKLREVTDDPIDIYVMQPSDEQILQYIAEDTERKGSVNIVKGDLEQVEIPTVQEGFAHVYAVTENGIEDWSDIDRVIKIDKRTNLLVKEYAEETERKVIGFGDKPFKHICEVCGKEEILTSKEAFDAGWDYPGEEGSSMGFFGVLSPRTCGNCSITDTAWWAVVTEGKAKEQLSERQIQTIERILQEPENLRIEESSE